MLPVVCKKIERISSQHLFSVKLNGVLIYEVIKYSRASVIQQFLYILFKPNLKDFKIQIKNISVTNFNACDLLGLCRTWPYQNQFPEHPQTPLLFSAVFPHCPWHVGWVHAGFKSLHSCGCSCTLPASPDCLGCLQSCWCSFSCRAAGIPTVVIAAIGYAFSKKFHWCHFFFFFFKCICGFYIFQAVKSVILCF